MDLWLVVDHVPVVGEPPQPAMAGAGRAPSSAHFVIVKQLVTVFVGAVIVVVVVVVVVQGRSIGRIVRIDADTGADGWGSEQPGDICQMTTVLSSMENETTSVGVGHSQLVAVAADDDAFVAHIEGLWSKATIEKTRDTLQNTVKHTDARIFEEVESVAACRDRIGEIDLQILTQLKVI
jgi:hypothetical protein